MCLKHRLLESARLFLLVTEAGGALMVQADAQTDLPGTNFRLK